MVISLAEELQQASALRSTDIHQQLIAAALRSPTPQQSVPWAERYLRTLEEASSPASAPSYALVLSALFAHRRVLTSARARAWNLFGHARLVAHPVPSVEMYNAMIHSCSLDDRVAPERALDLFTEMLEHGTLKPDYRTYLALLRTCARSKNDMFYYEALRLLKELLDRNFRPEKDIFDALLEGAKPRADLERAKWITGNMLSMASSGNAALQPDDHTMANLLLTYATYSPARRVVPKRIIRKSGLDDAAQAEKEENAAVDFAEHDFAEQNEGTLQQQGSAEPAEPISDDQPSNLRLLTPGQPADRTQVVAQATEIMSAIFRANKLDVSVLPGAHDASPTSSVLSPELESVFSRIRVTPSLLNAYLTVLTQHAPSSVWYGFFTSAFSTCALPYTHASWDVLFSALEKPKKVATPTGGTTRVPRTRMAREAFTAWRSWMDSQERAMADGQASEQDRAQFDSWRDSHVQTQWARMINAEAKSHKPFAGGEMGTPHLDTAMALLEDFADRYSEQDIIGRAEAAANTFTGTAGSSAGGEAESPSYLVEMSSFLYPETSDLPTRSTPASVLGNRASTNMKLPPAPSAPLSRLTASSGRCSTPPHLSFASVYPLFHRLTEIEDRTRVGRVKRIVGKYARALQQAEQVRARSERGEKRGVKEARKRLVQGWKVTGRSQRTPLLQDAQGDLDRRDLGQI